VTLTTAEEGRLGLNFHINPEKLAAAQALEGKYVLATNADHLSAHDMLRLYKGQDKVEKANRTVKGPLQVRPVFLRTDERIEGLVLCTMLALLVRAILALPCRRVGLADSPKFWPSLPPCGRLTWASPTAVAVGSPVTSRSGKNKS
jgi:transposase